MELFGWIGRMIVMSYLWFVLSMCSELVIVVVSHCSCLRPLHVCLQGFNNASFCHNGSYIKCAASVDSFSDYGQFAISENRLGHILYSAATAQSTMDFSVMPLDDGVVDSPPNMGKRLMHNNSPSPLKCQPLSSSPWDRSGFSLVAPRKLYKDKLPQDLVEKVWSPKFSLFVNIGWIPVPYFSLFFMHLDFLIFATSVSILIARLCCRFSIMMKCNLCHPLSLCLVGQGIQCL